MGLAFVAASGVAMAQQTADSEDLLASARAQIKRNGEALRSFKVPTAAEPSFAFRP
jgi:hypothetical protein